MRRLSTAILVAAGLALLAVTGPGQSVAATTHYQESFETGLGGWQPATDGLARDWKISRDRCQAVDGVFCLLYYLDGSNDDGTIWVERQFSVPAQDSSRIDMSFWLWNEVESQFGGWQVVAYIGPDRPAEELDFTIVGSTQEGLGWQQYKHSVSLDNRFDQTIWLAFGISAVWEVTRTHPVDLVDVEIN